MASEFSEVQFAKMLLGVQLFNQQKYWECHEALEEVWLEDRQDQVRNIYWAIIQVAAALVHYRDENLAGALSLWTKAKEKLDRCETYGVESDFLHWKLNWKEFKRLVRSLPSAPKLNDFTPLFDFRFTSQGAVL